MKMPWGKHRNLEITDLPDNYLAWLFEKADLAGALELAVENEYWARFNPPQPLPAYMAAEMPENMRSICAKLVEAGYRQLTLKNHPDVGGDVRAMTAINQAAEILRELVGRPS